MVRCIPVFIVLSLIAPLCLNHPINVENVEEIIETAGIQAFEESEPTETLGIQAVDDTEDTSITAGIQAVDDEDEVMDFELFTDINDDVVTQEVEEANALPEQNAPIGINQDIVDAYEDFTMKTLNNLSLLNIFRSNPKLRKNNKRDNDSDSDSDSDSDNDSGKNDDDEPKDEDIFAIYETENTAATTKVPEVETVVPTPEAITNIAEDIPTEYVEENINEIITDTPTENIEEVTLEKRDDEVEVALFEIEEGTEDIFYETVTEMVTEVHVVSVIVEDDDDNQPTIEAINIDEDDVEEEIPLFGVVVENDEEVLIAKRDGVFDVDVIEQVTAPSETESPIVIGQQEQNIATVTDDVATDAVTDVVEEEDRKSVV